MHLLQNVGTNSCREDRPEARTAKMDAASCGRKLSYSIFQGATYLRIHNLKHVVEIIFVDRGFRLARLMYMRFTG